ncbi:hypothetical protein D6V68_22090 [Escherichia albertii]|nr:hypothetical protein [Escherichia albertii]EFO0111955.1 hypothetical protein [Escherichia albertii]MLY53691.1 hypothetical protein [Escherichia albertii]
MMRGIREVKILVVVAVRNIHFLRTRIQTVVVFSFLKAILLIMYKLTRDQLISNKYTIMGMVVRDRLQLTTMFMIMGR